MTKPCDLFTQLSLTEWIILTFTVKSDLILQKKLFTFISCFSKLNVIPNSYKLGRFSITSNPISILTNGVQFTLDSTWGMRFQL